MQRLQRTPRKKALQERQTGLALLSYPDPAHPKASVSITVKDCPKLRSEALSKESGLLYQSLWGNRKRSSTYEMSGELCTSQAKHLGEKSQRLY